MTPRIFERRSGEKAQSLVLFALSLVMLLGFAGLGTDAGILYTTKAQLNKAVDAGAITATRYVGRPEAEMRRFAYDAVRSNFRYANLDLNRDISVRFERNARGMATRVFVDVEARHVQRTFFIRALGIPAFKEVPLRAAAQAVRFPIIMAIIVDRSGSMIDNGGHITIRNSLPQFTSNFIQGFDTIGLFSYSSVAALEMDYTTNFQSEVERICFNSSHPRYLRFGGWTAPSDALRMAMDRMIPLEGYNERGVKKIIVFMTDGIFNTVRVRAPNTLGAFNTPPVGMSQSLWNSRWFANAPINAYGTDIGQDVRGGGGGITFTDTSFTEAYRQFRMINADLVLASNANVYFPVIGQDITHVFRLSNGSTLTNRYNITRGSHSYPNGYLLNNSNDTSTTNSNSNRFRIRLINSSFEFARNTEFYIFRDNVRFLSARTGNMEAFTATNTRLESENHALRYCNAVRRTNNDPNKVTVFCIGFGTDTEINIPILKQMANVQGNSPPYRPINPNAPYDDTFGFTHAINAEALQRTYVALGLYLSTRLTR
jgi:hypothetical protein